jgi:hypothetical protein
VESGVSSISVAPAKSGACKFSVGWSDHEVVVAFGQGARIELGPNDEDLDVLQGVISGVVAGNVTEFMFGSRTYFQVMLEDGTALSDLGPVALLLRRLNMLREVPYVRY